MNFAKRTFDSVKMKTDLENKIKTVKGEIKDMRVK